MKKQDWTIIFSGLGLAILILDTKTAIYGITEGIAICLQTLIPSLFLFILLSSVLTTSLLGKKIPFLGSLCKQLGMPAGTESIFLVGLLGGYPIGAQCVANAVHNSNISRENGERMLSFCSNAGPAFLFGLGTRLFPSVGYCWLLWGMHIVSAIIVGFLTPSIGTVSGSVADSVPISIPAALRKSIQTMALICGWVIIFRVILAFCQRWFLWLLPQEFQWIFCGILELSNGCCALAQIGPIEMRFVLFSVFLGFGGLCILLQTISVCNGLNISWYLTGKLMQSVISLFLSMAFISREMRVVSIIALVLVCVLYYFIYRKHKKGLAFLSKQVYNKEKSQRGTYHAIS